MNDFKIMYSNMLKMTKEQRISAAQKSITNFKNTAKFANMEPEKVKEILEDFLKLFVCADKKTGDSEREIYNKIMGTNLTKEAFLVRIAGGTKAVFRLRMKDVARHLAPNMRAELATIGAAVLCSDNELAPEEEALMDEIFA